MKNWLIKLHVFITFLLSSFLVSASSLNWDLATEIKYYQEFYSSAPGYSGIAFDNQISAKNKKMDIHFISYLKKLDHTKYQQMYIYYELGLNSGHFFFLWLGINEQDCEAVYSLNKAKIKKLAHCRNIKVSTQTSKPILDKAIWDDTFIGLTKFDNQLNTTRRGTISFDTPSDIVLGIPNKNSIFDKIEKIFNGR